MSYPALLAIIPAAGHSRRMGQPKLLLPWRGGTVISHLIGELNAAGVSQILVIVRGSDTALAVAVAASGGTVVQPPTDPPDMRSSVEIGLQAANHLQGASSVPEARKPWLLIPADHPIVSRTTVADLRGAWKAGSRQILIPTYGGRRGHPTLFSAEFAEEVTQIPVNCGLNWLVRQHASSIYEVPVTDPGVVIDLDTPEDYAELLKCNPEVL